MNKTYDELCQEVLSLRGQLEESERKSEMHNLAFITLCRAFEELEQKLGMNTGGGMGPGPALNAVDAVIRNRTELAAHLERMRTELTACQSVLHQLARDGEVTPSYADDAKIVLKETPAASLAALKAKHWREAWAWIDQEFIDDFDTLEESIFSLHVDKIERGEA